jgi:hypothetical protein
MRPARRSEMNFVISLRTCIGWMFSLPVGTVKTASTASAGVTAWLAACRRARREVSAWYRAPVQNRARATRLSTQGIVGSVYCAAKRCAGQVSGSNAGRARQSRICGEWRLPFHPSGLRTPPRRDARHPVRADLARRTAVALGLPADYFPDAGPRRPHQEQPASARPTLRPASCENG